MGYLAKAVANEFLKLAQNENATLTQMKLQKLVYIAHGFNLALVDSALLEDKIQAWQYGPVIPSLYGEFKSFGNSPITRNATITKIDNDFNINHKVPKIDDKKTKELIVAVWETL